MFIILIIYIPDMIKSTKERTDIIEKSRRDQIDELVKLEIEKLRAADAEKEKAEPAPENIGQGGDAAPEEMSGESEEETKEEDIRTDAEESASEE